MGLSTECRTGSGLCGWACVSVLSYGLVHDRAYKAAGYGVALYVHVHVFAMYVHVFALYGLRSMCVTYMRLCSACRTILRLCARACISMCTCMCARACICSVCRTILRHCTDTALCGLRCPRQAPDIDSSSSMELSNESMINGRGGRV